MKVLVLGCTGMAGHMIALYFKERGHEVEGIARHESVVCKTIIADAMNTDLLTDIITNGNYDAVINGIGVLNQFADENKSNAVFLNSYLPHFLANITRNLKTKVVTISTDCVFSGKCGNYTEHDITDGTTFYDRTKALGELIDDHNITLRCSVVGPDISKNGIGLLNWFLQQEGTVNGYANALWTGQTTLQLAKTIEAAIQANVSGLFNMVNDTSISKLELIKLFNKYFRHDSIHICSVENPKVDKTLKRTNFDFDYTIPDYETMIYELSVWTMTHKELYPHYFKTRL